MQREIAGLGEAGSVGQAEAAADRAFQRGNQQRGVADAERPIARALVPAAVRPECRKALPRGGDHSVQQPQGEAAIARQYGQGRDDDPGMRHDRKVLGSCEPRTGAVAVGRPGRLQNVPQQGRLDGSALSLRQPVIKPIIGKSDGNRRLGAVEKGLDDRPVMPGRRRGEGAQNAAGPAFGFYFATAADQSGKRDDDQPARFSLDPLA
jgi:hypothetical protein